jgi:hypothetical protein
MSSKRNQFGVLAVRFLLAVALATVLLVALAAIDRAWFATLRLTLLVVPASIAVGFLPLLYWYRRDAYPIGLMFVPAAYFWLLYFARLAGLAE